MVINTPNGPLQRAASIWVEAYLELIESSQEAIKEGKPPHPYLQQLGQIDPSWIQECLRARDLSKTIAKEYLKKYMLKSKSEKEIEAIVDKFIEIGEDLSHGLTIRPQQASDYGLEVEIIGKNSKIEPLIWELSQRCQRYVQSKVLAKYILCRNGGLNISITALKLSV